MLRDDLGGVGIGKAADSLAVRREMSVDLFPVLSISLCALTIHSLRKTATLELILELDDRLILPFLLAAEQDRRGETGRVSWKR
jgi:hypothetical protein